MAYRKTEYVTQKAQATRRAILDAAIYLIERRGIEELKTNDVAARAAVANGLIFSYFPDKGELIAAVIGEQLQADIDAMNKAAKAQDEPLAALIAAIAVFYNRMGKARLVAALFASPDYRRAITGELERLLRPTAAIRPRQRPAYAAAIVGALPAFYALEAKTADLCEFVLRVLEASPAERRHLLPR